MRNARSSPAWSRVLLVLVLTSTSAAAQTAPVARPPTPSLADLQEAARETEVAARLSGEGVFERALIHYQRAYDLAHKPADLRKVAECQRALGDLGAAHDTYVTLLATHGPALGFQSIAVKKAIAETEAATGLLTVRSIPDGASVRAGPRFVGVTPLPAAVRLPAGDTQVEVLEDGFEPFTATVHIDPAQPASIEAKLVAHPTTGHLAVRESNGRAARLILDGRDVGPLPWEGEVAPGTHQLVLEGGLLKAAPLTASVRVGGRAEGVFIATSTSGHLRVTTRPPGATIELDGKPVGTGTYEADVVSGDHKVRVSAPGFKASEEVVSLGPQGMATANMELERYVSPEEIARAQAEKEAETYRGAYGQVALFGALGVDTDHICSSLPVGSAGIACTTGLAYAGGVSVRGGYSFGALGIEGVAVLMADYANDSVTYTAPATSSFAPGSIADVSHGESYSWLRTAGMIAAGPRFITPGQSVRFTIGAAGGLVIREVFLTRTLSGNAAELPPYSDAALVLSPGLTADIGLTIGSVPGASFSFGAMVWTDFPSATQVPQKGINQSVTTASGSTILNGTVGPFTVESGPQVYVGPYLGLRWGH